MQKVKKLKAKEKKLEKTKVKTSRERQLEKRISKLTGKKYVGKRQEVNSNMSKKATAKQLAARAKFTKMVKAKAAKKGGKAPVKGGVTKSKKMPMIGGKPAWLAKKGKKATPKMGY